MLIFKFTSYLIIYLFDKATALHVGLNDEFESENLNFKLLTLKHWINLIECQILQMLPQIQLICTVIA